MTRPPASSARTHTGGGAPQGGAITRPPAAGGEVSKGRYQATREANSEKARGAKAAGQKRDDQLQKNLKIADPTLKKQADDLAQQTFDKEMKATNDLYDQQTLALGGTPGGEKKKPASAGPPKGATVAYKDKNGVVQGYAVNGVYVAVGK